MPKIVKSISLDDRTAPIANAKENFSAWVRVQLLSEIAHTIPCSYFQLTHVDRNGQPAYREIRDKKTGAILAHEKVVTEEICNGMSNPPCPRCYPEGPPDRKDWLDYTRHQIGLEELKERAAKKWEWRTEQRNKAKTRSKNEQSAPQMGGKSTERAYVRRLLQWIWSFIW